MKIQTFSCVVGSRACDANCPFCVSKMTGYDEISRYAGDINDRNLAKAIRLAKMGGTTTALLTGKGEPTLAVEELNHYIYLLGREFPFVELQTNGLSLGRLFRDGSSPINWLNMKQVEHWHKIGLDTIALSVVDVETAPNSVVYHDDYPCLKETIYSLHKIGFSVRLCVMLHKGYVEKPADLERVFAFCHENKVEQLTIRPLRVPVDPLYEKAGSYIGDNGLTAGQVSGLYSWVRHKGNRVLTLMHGAEVFDVDGQNICISDCLTVDSSNDDIRTLIFYSNGRIAYDWQYRGAVLLGSVKR